MKYSKVYKQILNALMDFLFIDVELVVIVVIYDPTSGRISLPTIKAFCQPRSIAQLHSDLKHKNTIKI